MIDTKTMLDEIRTACLNAVTWDQKAATRAFKVAPGTYGEHDRFLGITVPNVRKILKVYKNIDQTTLLELLASPYNEERLLALLILIHQYQKATPDSQKKLCTLYLKNSQFVNNWNLVDTSAHAILGHYLWDKNRSILYDLVKSPILWERRIAIVATWYFIRKGDLAETFQLAECLLNDKEDLIHKATGWMLREAGKKDEKQLIEFLSRHAYHMPKIMLRYARERLGPQRL